MLSNNRSPLEVYIEFDGRIFSLKLGQVSQAVTRRARTQLKLKSVHLRKQSRGLELVD